MKTVLVTGASGHLGRGVLEELSGKDFRVIGTTRKPEAGDVPGVEYRRADFSEKEGLVEAFRGADKLLLISTDAIGVRLEQHKNAIEAAKTAGVKHIIYTSWPSPDQTKASVGFEHHETEKLIQESGLSYTFLRNFLYTDLLIETYKAAVSLGTLFGASGDQKAAYVTRKDCARIAARELSSEDFSNKIIDVTGPQGINYSELAEYFSQMSGKKIPYVELSPESFKRGLVQSGMPEAFADLLLSFELSIKEGELRQANEKFLKETGINTQPVKDFLFHWKAQV